MNCMYLPYSRTGYFSSLVIDYLDNHAHVQPFYAFTPDMQGIKSAIEARKAFTVNRETLAGVVTEQYRDLQKSPQLQANIDLLKNENTFTICTAHQPNLLTGYLYFIYKIVHAIRLTSELKAQFPDYNFVPVYYMGSEDNDLDELGTFRYEGKKFVWDAAGQTGAVGRMSTQSLEPLLNELFSLLGPPGAYCDTLKEILSTAYIKHDNIADATQYLVNELFGRYGLITLNPDVPAFKAAYVSVMKDDLLNHTPYSVVSKQMEQLETHYKVQAHPRPVNLFYLKDSLRERIEKTGDTWQVVNTDINFTEETLEAELTNHPERFSPNVILRGMFQETILPNIVFIGGGAEVAYWLQLKSLFEHYNVFYPVIMLRQSVLWINERLAKTRKQLELSFEDIFKDEAVLLKQYITLHSNSDWQTTRETKAFEATLEQLRRKATSVDPTLRASAEAALTKIKHQLEVLEKKMLKAEKRKMADVLNKIIKLKNELFPNDGLQERIENFSEYFLLYGHQYFDLLYKGIQPLQNEFFIMEEENEGA